MRKPSAGASKARHSQPREKIYRSTRGKKVRGGKNQPRQKVNRPSVPTNLSKNQPASQTRKNKAGKSFGEIGKKRAGVPGYRQQRFSDDRLSHEKQYHSGIREKKRTQKHSQKPTFSNKPKDDTIRLNKFVANAGVCSRREADILIRNGAITVNGKIITEMGVKVKRDDVVMYGNERLFSEKKVYILLNKPKNYITTSDDPQKRKTVLDLIRGACPERVYPVGRLDRNTTGLLLLTNDGLMAKKLTHPKHKVKKLYHVFTDKAVTKADLDFIAKGVKIDDNLVVPDAVSYIDKAENKKELGIELHSGQNRIVRRIFEHFGYKVIKLDRVVFAGLTKKDLPRGKWRFLTEKEVSFLKMKSL